MDSILDTIKQMLQISADCDSFDGELIVHINSALSVLNRLGVGPKNGFSIRDNTATWADFIGSNEKFGIVKEYIYIKVKMLFDPPLSSFVAESMKETAKEYEWRITEITDE